MIDWDTLIRTENAEQNTQNVDNCRNMRGVVGTEDADCRNSESKHSCDSTDFVPTVPTIPTQNKGGWNGNIKTLPDNQTHPINPMAVTLLLTCCNKATIDREETIAEILKLQNIPQIEQVRSWAMLCQSHGIDPHRVTRTFTQHASNGTSCSGCKYIDMQLIDSAEHKRKVYRFLCGKKHSILEAFYVGERVLLAPETCNDYQTTA